MTFLARFKKSHPPKSDLGSVLMDMHVLSEEQLHAAVAIQEADRERRLGEVLIKMGAINEDHLRSALELQNKMRTGKRLDAVIEITQHNFHAAIRDIKANT